jgi:endonuclease YncB( thermonuclease family)
MLAGDPHAAKSFAVLEHAAAKINKSPKLQAQLADIGGVNDVAALHVFGKEYKQTLAKVGENVDKSVVTKMGDKAIDYGERRGSAQEETESGESYNLTVSANTKFEVVDGAHVRMANNENDLKDGKGIVMRLEGIVAPPEGVSTRSGKLDAGIEAKSNLQEVISRHGVGSSASIGISVKQLDSGESVVSMRTKDGENLSQRMLRDGFAIPTKDGFHKDRKEALAKQAEGNGRGLWAEGFPEMDQSWRREKSTPEMTWKDKRHNLERNVNDAMCTTKLHVARNLTRSETKLFALPLKSWSDEKSIDKEILKVANKNPTRIMDIYNNNMELLEDLRKRKDKLSQPEKVAHDKLAMGRRALGEVLVSKNLMDPAKFKKDSHPFMSQSGIKISKDGIRALGDATATIADKAIETTRKGAKRAKSGAMFLLDEAMN